MGQYRSHMGNSRVFQRSIKTSDPLTKLHVQRIAITFDLFTSITTRSQGRGGETRWMGAHRRLSLHQILFIVDVHVSLRFSCDSDVVGNAGRSDIFVGVLFPCKVLLIAEKVCSRRDRGVNCDGRDVGCVLISRVPC